MANDSISGLPKTRINTVEAVNSQVQRALIGVYHRLGRQHLQKYLDEILWRWNHR
ncbi:transposase [Shimia thalassica]|nr:transposase [Shimia thalassica]